MGTAKAVPALDALVKVNLRDIVVHSDCPYRAVRDAPTASDARPLVYLHPNSFEDERIRVCTCVVRRNSSAALKEYGRAIRLSCR